tara:strand:+ start:425 stop:622 length:198 start_codon:yes stop_codon:yes gene_type:complete
MFKSYVAYFSNSKFQVWSGTFCKVGAPKARLLKKVIIFSNWKKSFFVKNISFYAIYCFENFANVN